MASKIGDDKSLVGLAGEYHVLAQLAERGLVGALTLGHTKGVDILVANPETGHVNKIEVKTSRKKPGRASIFGEGRFFMWQLSAKNEKPLPDGWFYCFVWLPGAGILPRFFIVPAPKVAEYVQWQHQHWLVSRHEVKDNAIRVFRIPESDPEKYEDNWAVFI